MKLLSTLLLTAAATTTVVADTDRTQEVRNLQSPVVAPVGPPMAGGSSPTPAPVPDPTPAPVNPVTAAPVTPPTPAPVPAANNNAAIPIPMTPIIVNPPVSMNQPVTVTVSSPVAPAISGDEPAVSEDEPVAPSIIDLAAADGKYGTLLSAVTNTPGVLDAIAEAFPVSKWLWKYIHWLCPRNFVC